eukprot:scaffold71056_cov33-Cyclotella_meneghiniana.AAC.1
MRQAILPYTFGKDDKHTKRTGQRNIGATFKCVYQATHNHNLGRKSNKHQQLTCTLYNSGISSSPHMAIHSEHHCRHWDLVPFSATETKWYHDENLLRYERTMKCFFLLEGKEDEGITAINEAVKQFNQEKPENRQGGLGVAKEISLEEVEDSHCITLSKYVCPISTSQLDAAWWAFRTLSMTSSTCHAQIKMMAKYINVDHPLREAFEIVGRFANFYKILPKQPGSDDNESPSGEDENDPQFHTQIELSDLIYRTGQIANSAARRRI